ncbi:hypothetical protein [Streptomyces sp. 900105245]
MPTDSLSHRGGRPIKPIPDDVPFEVRHLAQELRDLIRECLPPKTPISSIAEAAGIGKSTLFHALSGQRVPSLDTVLMVVNACEAARAKPDMFIRLHGPVLAAEVKKHRMKAMQKQTWATLVNHARHPVSRTDDCDLLYLSGHGTSEAAPGLALEPEGSKTLASESRVSERDMDAGTGSTKEVGVAAAAAALDRALRSLEQATRDVAHARAVLARAIALSTSGVETPEAEVEEAARSGYAAMREELLDAEQQRERDQPAGDAEGNVLR